MCESERAVVYGMLKSTEMLTNASTGVMTSRKEVSLDEFCALLAGGCGREQRGGREGRGQPVVHVFQKVSSPVRMCFRTEAPRCMCYACVQPLNALVHMCNTHGTHV